MKSLYLSLVLIMFSFVIADTQSSMHDFTVVDVDGHTHRLYPDYLNQGKTVVIKFFFSTCPPCIANAPSWQQSYVQWGQGTQGVEFFSVTTITSDYDQQVINFENTYGQTMKGISQDGGAQSISNPFKSGNYGSWYGTPSFAVIAPNGKLYYPVFFNELNSTITTAKMQSGAAPTAVQLNIETDNLSIPDGHVKFYISPKGAATPKIEIPKNGQGNYTFSYPSTSYPTMTDPEITMVSTGPAYTNKVTASDLLAIQKHILELAPFTDAAKILAADVNSDNKVTASDLLNIKKIILGLSTDFPNNTPSYKSIPEKLDLIPQAGNTVALDFKIVKIGNVN